MKTFITCILFSVCYSISLAQNYVPFPTSNAVWRGQRDYIEQTCPSMVCWHYVDFNQFINGDTIINGLVYHNLYETSIDNLYSVYQNYYLISSTYNAPYSIGQFREDNNKHLYYFRYWNTFYDSLLFDFNLSIGDTFRSTLNYGGYLKVSAIDSVFDGTVFRKKYFLDNDTISSNNFTPWFIIEGIGSNGGFTDQIVMGVESESNLYCFRENNIIKYSDSIHNCSLVNIKENQSQQSSFTLSPNPTTEILNLKSEQPILFPLELFVMDMRGRLITQKIIYNTGDLSLNVKSFTNGEYLLAIKNKESVLFHGIFSKQ